MQKLQDTSGLGITLLDGASATVAVPPAAASLGLVASTWQRNGDTPAELELAVWASGSRALTGAQLYVGALHQITFADTVVTGNATSNELAATAHGRESGDGPALLTGAGVPGGTDTVTQYYVHKISANAMRLALTREDALKGTNLVDLTSAGSGTINLVDIPGTTQRVFWHATGLLGPANDGAISLDANAAYQKVIAVSVAAVAFALIATFGAGAGVVTAAVLPRYDRS